MPTIYVSNVFSAVSLACMWATLGIVKGIVNEQGQRKKTFDSPTPKLFTAWVKIQVVQGAPKVLQQVGEIQWYVK